MAFPPPPSALSRVMVMVAMALLAGTAAASYYKVGDADGWRVPDKDDEVDMYETWAKQYSFYVGDSLIFEYTNDSVVRVDKRGYYHCNETRRGAKHEDGKTVFMLDEPGFHYFSSGDLEHCKSGQRLMIEALEDSSLTPPYSAAPSPAPQPNAAVTSWDAASLSGSLITTFGALTLMALGRSVA